MEKITPLPWFDAQAGGGRALGFIAEPGKHFFLKPNVTKLAARSYGFDFQYQSKPNWQTYSNLLFFAESVRRDLRDLQPQDMIDT